MKQLSPIVRQMQLTESFAVVNAMRQGLNALKRAWKNHKEKREKIAEMEERLIALDMYMGSMARMPRTKDLLNAARDMSVELGELEKEYDALKHGT